MIDFSKKPPRDMCELVGVFAPFWQGAYSLIWTEIILDKFKGRRKQSLPLSIPGTPQVSTFHPKQAPQ